MAKLNFSEEEQLTRKEYLKSKKKQDKKLRKNGKKYIWVVLVAILAIYVFIQFYIYNINNERYSTVDVVEKQPVYGMYFLSEGYTYVPKTSLNYVKTNSLNENSVYRNIELQNIKSSENNIYGLKENALYRLNKPTHELGKLIEKDVKEYAIYNDEVYAVIGDENSLKLLSPITLELKDLGIKGVKQIVIDENRLFIVSSILNDNKLYSISKDGKDKKELTKKFNISYMIGSNDKLFFVNKSDKNYIYSINKDGSNPVKVSDIETYSDKGKCDWINGSKYMNIKDNNLIFIDVKDGNKLKMINLETKEIVTEILSSVSEFRVIDDTVIYMINKEKGVYLHNIKTKFSSQIITKLVKEFLIER